MVKVIENYVLAEAIGQGNFGTVYRATNKTKPNQQFAIKVIPIQKFHENEKLETYTTSEIQALSTIGTADNIIKYYQMIKSKHNYYFVYEYCDGGTLMDLLKKQHKLQQKVALLILKQLIEGFKVLSRNNIMHRDLKPENVFFTSVKNITDLKRQNKELLFNRMKTQRVKIGDFGFCKGLKPEENLAKTMLGSPIYMAPEVLKGQSYSSKADIWALGVLLYQMLYGVCPYQSNSIAMLINTIDTKPIVLPSDAQVSQKTQNLIKRLLTKDFYRRIGWAQLFSYRINQQGEYIEEKTQTNQQNKANKKVFTSLFMPSTVQPPACLSQQNKSYSMHEEEQKQKALLFKNKKIEIKPFHSPKGKMLELSYNKDEQYGIQNHDSPKIRKQNFSTPKEQRKFNSQKYMSILYTPLSITRNAEPKQNSIDRNKQCQLRNNNVKVQLQNVQPDQFSHHETQKIIPSRNRAHTGNIEEMYVHKNQYVSNRQEKVMSLIDLKQKKIQPRETRDTLPRSPPNRQYQYPLYSQTHQYICSKEQPTTSPTSPSTSNLKRQSLLHAHEKIVTILIKIGGLMEQQSKSLKQRSYEQKQNKQTKIEDFLHDMYLILKLLQEKLKEITIAIKITETNLLDMASIINYELIQVERMLIQVRNQIIKNGVSMPQWTPTNVKNYDCGEIYDRSWDVDLSGFRVKEIKGFISAQC